MTTTLKPGNWREFDSFCWFDRPDDADDFALIYTHNRDSDLIDVSNAYVIGKALEPYPDDAIPESHSHWAVGWIDGFAIRIGSEAERIYLDLKAQMDDYPILDENHYSQLESDAQDEAWENWARHDFHKELEQALGMDLELSADALDELFRKLADSSNTYWEVDYIDLERVAQSAELDDVRPFVPVQGFKVYHKGRWFANGTYHCGLIEGPENYAAEFDLIQTALDAELDTVDGFTWEID